MSRTQIHTSEFAPIYKEKTILITGSVGTVGSEVLKQILKYDPAEVRIFDNNETSLYLQMSAYGNDVNLVPILGDIRDHGKLQSVMEGVDVVFHIAAYKHVFLCECNPFDSVRTNVIGTQNVLSVALANRVPRVLYTSSDKAVNPTNVMGTSKLLSERVVTAASMQRCNGRKLHNFSSTRFGNVLGSNGSVVPVFVDQIKRGGPVTITNPRMTRFVMTVEEAARLVIKGAAIACGGEVFVTKMPVLRIIDLAQAMIEVLAPPYGYRPKDITFEYIGARPGEKLYEELMSEEEAPRSLELDDMFAILPALRNGHNMIPYDYHSLVSDKVDKPYISRDETMMTKDEIIEFLLVNNILGEDVSSRYMPEIERRQKITAL
ncbi:MAG: polysaccharide biosynthesis protein [Desulfobacteraceae bacterium]|nr:MAG: polysaccharide biosynthesis protein [Desulfobacteraceae bacterium]